MIGIDTNVLVRFFVEDDAAQSHRAVSFFCSLSDTEPGWISQATILEFVWVMKSVRRLDRKAIAVMLTRLSLLDSIVVEGTDVLEKALQRYRTGKAEFADCLIAAGARKAGCSKTVTFDEIAARDAGMELLV